MSVSVSTQVARVVRIAGGSALAQFVAAGNHLSLAPAVAGLVLALGESLYRQVLPANDQNVVARAYAAFKKEFAAVTAAAKTDATKTA